MVGTSFPYTQHLPEPGKVRVVQIDSDPTRVGLRMPTEVPLVGDARETLTDLLPYLTFTESRRFLMHYQEKMDSWRADMRALESSSRDPIAPQYVVSVIDDLAADDAILTCDSGTIATWAARHWTIRGDRQFYLSGNLATMAPGLPYAIAMQHAFPGRQVIAYVGDGGFAMLMAEFRTAVRYGWPIKVVVNNNNSLGQILWEQMVLGFPEHGVRFSEPEADYAAWATACHAFGAKVSRPGDVPAAIRDALAYDGPALVDVDVDPDEPPLPGKVSYEQAKKFAQAFLKGQPRRAAIATTLAKDKIQQLKA
jgi:pyruvate dehydrogenase (quinone)/pyruvate oxidase